MRMMVNYNLSIIGNLPVHYNGFGVSADLLVIKKLFRYSECKRIIIKLSYLEHIMLYKSIILMN
jgi:hypothetical protein